MSIADEIRKLQELNRSGALTDAEFAQAKARVLAGEAAAPPAEILRDQLTEMQRQQALDRLDRAWDRERERYMVTSRYGHRYRPSKGNSIAMGAGAVAFGAVWVFIIANFGGGLHGAGGLFPLFGALFMAVGLGMAAFSFMRASQYDQAYRRYQRQRALLMAGSEDPEGDVADELAASPLGAPTSTAIQDCGQHATCPECGRAGPAQWGQCPHCGRTRE